MNRDSGHKQQKRKNDYHGNLQSSMRTLCSAVKLLEIRIESRISSVMKLYKKMDVAE